jgi:hypothetical protein
MADLLTEVQYLGERQQAATLRAEANRDNIGYINYWNSKTNPTHHLGIGDFPRTFSSLDLNFL